MKILRDGEDGSFVTGRFESVTLVGRSWSPALVEVPPIIL